MAYYQEPSFLFGLEQPLIINADSTDPFGVSNTPSFPTSTADWIAGGTNDIWPWDLAAGGNNDQTIEKGDEVVNAPEFSPSFDTSEHSSSMSYKDGTLKTEDTPHQELPMPEGECTTWIPYEFRSDHESDTSSHIVQVDRSKGKYTEIPSTSTSGGSTAALATTELQSPASSRRCSNDTISSTSSASASLTASQQAGVSDGSNRATAKKQKMACHNAIEKRYREHMKAKFLDIENAISGRYPSNESALYPHESMCGDSDKTQRRQQSKSKILTNAIAYIHELEADKLRLQGELLSLKEKLLSTAGMI